MRVLSVSEQACVRAAEGWLELGNWQEARAELDNIQPQWREHPVVLCMRWNVHAAAGEWEQATVVARKLAQLVPQIPVGWIQLAHALHALNRTEEARNTLLPVVNRFPGEALMRYKLACYDCQLGRLQEAEQWLESALALDDSSEVAKIALQDPELKPLWLARAQTKKT